MVKLRGCFSEGVPSSVSRQSSVGVFPIDLVKTRLQEAYNGGQRGGGHVVIESFWRGRGPSKVRNITHILNKKKSLHFGFQFVHTTTPCHTTRSTHGQIVHEAHRVVHLHHELGSNARRKFDTFFDTLG